MSRYLLLFIALLLLKAALAIGFILHGGLGLGPDEAQYWTWSKQLAWGYYSKPPGIAWQIWLGTKLLGDNELGVRIGAVVLGTLIPLAVYWLAREAALRPFTCFAAGLVMAFCPLGLLSTFLAITDGGLVLFWTLACIVVVRALRVAEPPDYLLLGLCILGGALFKWPIYYFWGLVIVLMIVYPWFRSLKVIGGVLISLGGLLPSLIWNAQHDWVTFRHVAATVQGGHGDPGGNVGSFLAQQAALLSPLIFLLLILAASRLIRGNGISKPIKFCGWSAVGLLALFALLSIFKKMQGNWCDFIYPPAIVFLCWYALESVAWGKWLLWPGVLLSVLLSAAAFSIPKMDIPWRYNPFRQNLGWGVLGKTLTEQGYNPQQDFLLSDKYQMTSLLSFYAPGQKRAYFLNLLGSRLNQFSFWPSVAEEQKNKTGYFVVAENRADLTKEIELYKSTLAHYFQKVEFLGVHPLYYAQGKAVKNALIFKGINYNGQLPETSSLY